MYHVKFEFASVTTGIECDQYCLHHDIGNPRLELLRDGKIIHTFNDPSDPPEGEEKIPVRIYIMNDDGKTIDKYII